MNPRIRPCPNKTIPEMIAEWDRIAKVRLDQIETGKDLTFKFILLPCLLQLARKSNHSRVLDIGCGSGSFAEHIAAISKDFIGIDPSRGSIEVAKSYNANRPNTEFIVSAIEDYAKHQHVEQFTLAFANMSLMTMPDLDGALNAIASLLKPGAHFVFTISHPWFWPIYWDYEKAEWFDYNKEIKVEAPFMISLEPDSEFITTHIHRPIWRYINGLTSAGLVVEEFQEPMPDRETETKYPNEWRYPRFLGIRCLKR